MRYERIGRVARRVGAATIVALAAVQVVSLVSPGPSVGHWRSAEAKERYAHAYADVLAGLPRADRTADVRTSFGAIRVLGWKGAAGDVPVLLVPGHSSGAPMWAENLPDWIGRRTVYAMDPLGDAGFSSQDVPMTGSEDQARVIAEVLDGLGLKKAHVVGHSFGGAVAAQFAVSHPGRVASLALVEPVIVLRPLPPSIYAWSAVLALPTPQSWKDHALAAIGGTSVEEVQKRTPMSEMIDAASSGYSTALPTPTELTDEQWASLAMPLRLDIGSASDLAGGVEAAERLKALRPGAHVTVWPSGTHSLPMDEHVRLDRELLNFWSAASTT